MSNGSPVACEILSIDLPEGGQFWSSPMIVSGTSCSEYSYVAPMTGTDLAGSAYVFVACMYLLS
jgi:hypothetical protein